MGKFSSAGRIKINFDPSEHINIIFLNEIWDAFAAKTTLQAKQRASAVQILPAGRSGLNYYTVKLGYNDHGSNEFMSITNKICPIIWSQMVTLLYKPLQS